MRMVYTNENRLIVANAKNILEARGFEIFVKNEHASSIVGDISAFDSWVELWVVDDADYAAACSVLANALSKDGDAAWICRDCGEENDASFEWCWQCGTERSWIER